MKERVRRTAWALVICLASATIAAGQEKLPRTPAGGAPSLARTGCPLHHYRSRERHFSFSRNVGRAGSLHRGLLAKAVIRRPPRPRTSSRKSTTGASSTPTRFWGAGHTWKDGGRIAVATTSYWGSRGASSGSVATPTSTTPSSGCTTVIPAGAFPRFSIFCSSRRPMSAS